MTSLFNKIYQISSVVGNVLVQNSTLIPVKYHPVIGGIIGVSQGLVAIIGHYYSPKGFKITDEIIATEK